MNANYLNISYWHGKMTINMDNFFPCTESQLKSLVRKVLNLDYEHRDELIQKLKDYFQFRMLECDQLYEIYRKEYFDWKEKGDYIVTQIALSKEICGDRKKLQEQKNYYKDKEKSSLKFAKQESQCKKKFEKLLKLLEELQR